MESACRGGKTLNARDARERKSGKLQKFKKQSTDEEVGLQSLVAGICQEADGIY